MQKAPYATTQHMTQAAKTTAAEPAYILLARQHKVHRDAMALRQPRVAVTCHIGVPAPQVPAASRPPSGKRSPSKAMQALKVNMDMLLPKRPLSSCSVQ